MIPLVLSPGTNFSTPRVKTFTLQFFFLTYRKAILKKGSPRSPISPLGLESFYSLFFPSFVLLPPFQLVFTVHSPYGHLVLRVQIFLRFAAQLFFRSLFAADLIHHPRFMSLFLVHPPPLPLLEFSYTIRSAQTFLHCSPPLWISISDT